MAKSGKKVIRGKNWGLVVIIALLFGIATYLMLKQTPEIMKVTGEWVEIIKPAEEAKSRRKKTDNPRPAVVAPTPPPGTYEIKNPDGTVAGYRYIQAPGVFEAAIKDAVVNPSSFNATLLKSTYGMTTQDIAEASTRIKNGQTWVPAGTGCGDGVNDGVDCKVWHWTTCLNPGSGLNGIGCDQVYAGSGGTINNPSPVPSPSPSLSPSPSPSPTPVAACVNMMVFSQDWTPLLPTDFAAGDNGKKIYLCVAGEGDGEFTRARFTVNGSRRRAVTYKKPGTEYFCDLYKIPNRTYSFQIQAEVYNSILGWK